MNFIKENYKTIERERERVRDAGLDKPGTYTRPSGRIFPTPREPYESDRDIPLFRDFVPPPIRPNSSLTARAMSREISRGVDGGTARVEEDYDGSLATGRTLATSSVAFGMHVQKHLLCTVLAARQANVSLH